MDIIEKNTPEEPTGGAESEDNSPDMNAIGDALDKGKPIDFTGDQDAIGQALAANKSLRDKNTPIG